MLNNNLRIMRIYDLKIQLLDFILLHFLLSDFVRCNRPTDNLKYLKYYGETEEIV